MKKIWLLTLALLALAACNSVIDPEQEVIDEPETPEAIAAGWRTPAFMPFSVEQLVVNAKGEVYVEGSDGGFFPQFLFRKYSAAGNFRWERTLLPNGIPYMLMGTDNKLYFLLRASKKTGTELAVYNTGGSLLRNINLTRTGRGTSWKMLLDKDNNVFVLYRGGEVVKYSPYGKELWNIRVGDPAKVNDPTGFIFDAQGNIKVFGYINNIVEQAATVSPGGQLLSLKPLGEIYFDAIVLALPNGSMAVVKRTQNEVALLSTLYILDKDDQLVGTHPLLPPGGKNFYAHSIALVGDTLTITAGNLIAQFGLDGQFKKKVEIPVGVGVITNLRFFDKYWFVSGSTTTRLGTQPEGAREGFVLRLNADLSL